jgi:hypothetical protein
MIAENANLRSIGNEAFSKCRSLRSFYVPASVAELGENSFRKCRSLHRLKFASYESLKTFALDSALDAALEKVGISEISSVMRIEIDDGEVDCDFPGWAYDELSHFALVKDAP